MRLARYWPALVAGASSAWIVYFGRQGWEGWISLLLAVAWSIGAVAYLVAIWRDPQPETWHRREDWQ